MKRPTKKSPRQCAPAAAPARGGPVVWRQARIERFAKAQRRRREWINFAEIADWCAREDQSIEPDERKRADAFDTLANDLLSGEFEESGRSRVLYLHPRSSKARMTPDWLRDAIECNYDGDGGRSGFLPHCWIPRHLFDRWLAKNRLPESPSRFEPIDEAPAAVGLTANQMTRTGGPGRPTPKHLIENELKRRANNGGISADASAQSIADELADWYENDRRKKQPDLPPYKSESIRRHLRAGIRNAIGQAKLKADAGRK